MKNHITTKIRISIIHMLAEPAAELAAGAAVCKTVEIILI